MTTLAALSLRLWNLVPAIYVAEPSNTFRIIAETELDKSQGVWSHQDNEDRTMAKESKATQDDVKRAMHKRKEGDAEERTERKDGQEQEAGDRHRPFGSSGQGQKGSGEEGILSRHSANSYSTAASCSLGHQLSRSHAAIVGRISEIAPLAQSVDARNRDYGDSASYCGRIGGRAMSDEKLHACELTTWAVAPRPGSVASWSATARAKAAPAPWRRAAQALINYTKLSSILKYASVIVPALGLSAREIEISTFRLLGKRHREPARPETHLQAMAGSQRHFSLAKVLLCAQSQLR